MRPLRLSEAGAGAGPAGFNQEVLGIGLTSGSGLIATIVSLK
jgi:hypothetical protein